MDEFAVKVTGLKEAQKALYSYSQQLGDKVVIDSLKQGARIIQRAAKAAAPVRTGRLKRAIVIKKSKIYNGKRRSDMIGVYLTILQGKRYGTRDAFYGRFQENGWEVRGKVRTAANTPGRWNRHRTKFRLSRAATRGRNSMRSGIHVPGKFFMTNAFMQNRINAVRMTIAAANAGGQILARKLGLKWQA